MTVHSENGWVAVADTSTLTRFVAAGQKWWAANADCAVLAGHLINRFNAEVEPIPGPVLDDWSWANRLIRGSTATVSNHGSATAWDLNALKHPRGVKGTYSSAHVAAVRRILAGITDDAGHQVFRWGNDYVSSPIDSMHFEINTTPAKAKQAAVRIRQQEDDMQLTDTVKLATADQVAAMNANGATYKIGDTVSVQRMLFWGGPGVERLYAHIRSLETQLNELTDLVKALSPTPPQ